MRQLNLGCILATLSLVSCDGDRRMDLRAYNDILASIAGVPSAEVTAKTLIKANRFGVTFCEGVIRPVTRENR